MPVTKGKDLLRVMKAKDPWLSADAVKSGILEQEDIAPHQAAQILYRALDADPEGVTDWGVEKVCEYGDFLPANLVGGPCSNEPLAC